MASLVGGLNTRLIGRKILYYPVLASTMDAARKAALDGEAGGTVIVAGEQTQGRGRLSRSWVSPRGSIALSIILYPEVIYLPYLVMITALAASAAIEGAASLPTAVKWPNDLIVGGKKVGGILIENGWDGGVLRFSIVGIGINVDMEVAAYPEIAEIAASLRSGGRDMRAELIRQLLAEFDRLYLMLPAEGHAIFEAWRGRLTTLGKAVTVVSGDQAIEGTAEAVDESGALRVRKPDGSSITVLAGDVSLREK
ncbi:MAG: biotin--[acetyl-CoA-carboxylase] ligase [Dehalococcoidales bacterium]|nr:biotin--[acetyl-CoA-carboxylase] ligase [Dehalococcoidales bacterium]